MKTLNITLTVNAPGYTSADELGKKNLMELVKIIGMRSGSSMASCTGETNHLEYTTYEVNATVKIDSCGDVSEIIKEAQRVWGAKPEILGSIIFVSEEEQKPEPVQKPRDYEPVTCKHCGQIMVKGYENVINPGTEDEYCLCERCYTDAVKDSEVIGCKHCKNSIDAEILVLNPVTNDYDLCPVCGNKIFG